VPNLTTTEAAELMQITPRRVRALIHSGRLRAKKVGRDWQIRRMLRSWSARQDGHSKLERLPSMNATLGNLQYTITGRPGRFISLCSSCTRRVHYPETTFEVIIRRTDISTEGFAYLCEECRDNLSKELSEQR
jgi:excisionase family DNA binding protein